MTDTLNAKALAQKFVDDFGYNEVRPGLYEWQTIAIGYSTDVAFTPDSRLPFRRVAIFDDRHQQVTVEARTDYGAPDSTETLSYTELAEVLPLEVK